MRALVFGANGQDGRYLTALLREQGIEALGVSRSGEWNHADVARFREVEELIRSARPDYVFQLAARSTTRHDALFENHETISTGALNVLEAAHRHCPRARVFIAGSAVQFKNTGAPIDEETPFEASSPYAVARIQSTYAARYYRSLGLHAYVGYLFHHESPLRPPGHVSRMIAEGARRIAAGSAEILEVGDISVIKEWTFALDTARAMIILLQQDQIFEVVIGSGEGHSIEEWLKLCFAQVGFTWQDHVRVREGFRAEYQRLISQPTRIMELGWTPRVSFEELAALMMQVR
jgi:GDPmannose 4,6-dehydratase